MDKEPKLKTKLDFIFNVEDLELPEMTFISEEPKEERKKEIQIIKKKSGRKSSQELF